MSKEMVEYHERRYMSALAHSLHLGVFHWAWEKRAMDHLKFARMWGELKMVNVAFALLAAISTVGIAAAISAGSATVTLLCIFCLGSSGLWFLATSKIK